MCMHASVTCAPYTPLIWQTPLLMVNAKSIDPATISDTALLSL
jgi:hypothetical protein